MLRRQLTRKKTLRMPLLSDSLRSRGHSRGRLRGQRVWEPEGEGRAHTLGGGGAPGTSGAA